MNYTLPKLPYSYDALEPYIDTRTMEIHHTKHHKTYIDKLNAAIEPREKLHGTDIEMLLKNLDEMPNDIQAAVRNHGGGHANHSFFWPVLKKGVSFSGPAADAIQSKFGDFDTFKTEFSNAATLLFGSGWTWLVFQAGELSIMTTPNQGSPTTQGKIPILGLDVWEHAYYLKYQNRRPDYIEAFFRVINWEKVNEHFESAVD